MYPEWRMRHFFNMRTLQNVMRRDSSDTTRPMTKTLIEPSDIAGAFDYTAYNKGEKYF